MKYYNTSLFKFCLTYTQYYYFDVSYSTHGDTYYRIDIVIPAMRRLKIDLNIPHGLLEILAFTLYFQFLSV